MLFNEYKPNRVSQFGKVQIIIWKKIIAIIDATFAAAKKGPEKIQIFFHTIPYSAVLIYDYYAFITSKNQ